MSLLQLADSDEESEEESEEPESEEPESEDEEDEEDEEAGGKGKERAATPESSVDSEAEFAALLEAMEFHPRNEADGEDDEARHPLKALLSVNARKLNPANEMREVFGGVGAGLGGGDERAGGPRRGRGASKPVRFRKSAFVVPRSEWPRYENEGLSMEVVGETEDGRRLFEFRYNAAYEALEAKFEQCASTHDPNTIMRLLRTHPYHVTSLLRIAEVFTQMAEMEQAEQYVLRAVAACEWAFHSQFNPYDGSCALRGETDGDAMFLDALFHLLQPTARKGLFRSAFELCKLMIGLDTGDPRFICLIVDYFAMRCEAYNWVMTFMATFSDGSLALLPNFAFSSALAKFELERAGGASATEDSEDGLAADVSSDAVLRHALALFPMALVPIMAKAGISDGRDAPLFFQDASTRSQSLIHLINLWVERGHELWKADHVKAWLMRNARALAKDLADGHAETVERVAAAKRTREREFPAKADNAFAAVDIGAFTDVTPMRLPEDHATPVVPGHLAAAPRGPDGRPVDEDLGNPLLAFFRTLNPFLRANR